MKREAIPFAILAIAIGTGAGVAQQSAQPAFPSAAEAGQSLFQAVQSNNEAATSEKGKSRRPVLVIVRCWTRKRVIWV